MKFFSSVLAVSAGLLASSANAALSVDISSPDSLKAGAQAVAKNLLAYYTGNQPGQIPGLLPGPYYWWEAGAVFGALVDYWYLTGDSQFNDIVTQALLFQTGPNADYMPPNRTKDEGNDDQSFWGMAAMSAAENKFPNPPSDKPQWLALAQAVFNTQASRWDAQTCGGGLRWQIFTFNNGYNYKNTIANACFFNIAARLGRYTGNTTYFEWADKAWNWMFEIGVVSSDYHSYDGSNADINCTQINHIEWTYNTGALLHGAAMMWNATQEQSVWEARISGILKQAQAVFFPSNNIMKEVACEDNNKCDTDQQSFKAYLSRWMGHTTKLAPFTAPVIQPLLQSSAKAAVSTCTGGSDGNQCGLKWTQPFDGIIGVGEELAVMEIIQSNLQPLVAGPVGQNTGGISQGNAAAGGGGDTTVKLDTITAGDRAGAGILTTIVLASTFGGAWWMASK